MRKTCVYLPIWYNSLINKTRKKAAGAGTPYHLPIKQASPLLYQFSLLYH